MQAIHHKYSILYFTSGGSALHNIIWRHTVTTLGTGLLLARSVAGPKVGDYSWHGTTPGTDYFWPVTPANTTECIMVDQSAGQSEYAGRPTALSGQ